MNIDGGLGFKLQLRLQISLKNKWGKRKDIKKDPLQEREEFR